LWVGTLADGAIEFVEQFETEASGKAGSRQLHELFDRADTDCLERSLMRLRGGQ
jgi:hypothetical protein